MLDQLFGYFIMFRLEFYAAVALFVLFLLQRRYANNEMASAFLRFMSDRIATSIENDPAQPGSSPNDPLSTKAKLRRNVRRELVQKARKANRRVPK